MGFHTSYIPFDPSTLRDRIFPFIAGKDQDMSDLIRRSERIATIRQEEAIWAQKITNLDRKISREQAPLVQPQNYIHNLPIRKPTFWDKILKRQIPTEEKTTTVMGMTTGIPGFDSYEIWRRPFFLVPKCKVDSTVQDFLRLINESEPITSSIAEIAQQFIQELERRRHQLPDDFSTEASEFTRNYPPYLESLSDLDGNDRWVFGGPKFKSILDTLRAAWVEKNPNSDIDDHFQGHCKPAESLRNSPSYLASALEEIYRPWSVEGTTWITLLLHETGLKTPAFFESLLSLFTPLLSSHPGFQKKPLNFHFDGLSFIAPSKISAFKDFIEQHRKQLKEAGDETSWEMIIESVDFALKNQLGLLEFTS